jgi:hypothetical protein
MLARQRQIAINLAQFRIDQHRRASIRATHQIRPAATGGYLLEYHDYPHLIGMIFRSYPGAARVGSR